MVKAEEFFWCLDFSLQCQIWNSYSLHAHLPPLKSVSRKIILGSLDRFASKLSHITICIRPFLVPVCEVVFGPLLWTWTIGLGLSNDGSVYFFCLQIFNLLSHWLKNLPSHVQISNNMYEVSMYVCAYFQPIVIN